MKLKNKKGKKDIVTQENTEINNNIEVSNNKETTKPKKNKAKIIIVSIMFILVVILSALGGLYIRQQNLDEKAKQERAIKAEKQRQELIKNIKANYAEIVYTTEETDLYSKNKDKYEKNGKVGKNVKLILEELSDITDKNAYIKINNIDGEYYIYYKDIKPKEKEIDEEGNEVEEKIYYHGMGSLSYRYKHYIPFNENVITKETYSLYDTEDNFLYTISGSLNKPILIKKSDKYYFEYNDILVYVKKEDVEKTESSNNSNETPASDMPVLVYHFFYDDNDIEEKNGCVIDNAIICTSTQEFSKHLDYIKNNGIFTVNMDEFEMFIDGELLLPDKTVLITMDDGWYNMGGVRKLTEYGLNGTSFLISAMWEPSWFVTDYVEVHSHSHDMHQNWKCPTSSSLAYESQGGLLLCADEQFVLDDLKASREKLYNTHVFCYPFFDYNDRSIDLLHKAGFTMAFLGGNQNARVGQNKMTIPRHSIISSFTVYDLARVVDN